MEITVNGTTESIQQKLSVADLLTRHNIQPIQVAVEINETIVSRRDFSSTMVHGGDRIEVVTFVGGG